MRIREIWELSLYYKPFLLLLLFCNVLGALYGYYWYAEQLSSTTWYFYHLYLIVQPLRYFYV